MLVSELRDHLKITGTASLLFLAQRFNADPNIVRDMLGFLIRKGNVKKCTQTPHCGSTCQRCDPLLTEIYQWVEG